MTYRYKTTSGGDWYEGAIVLYKGTPPATSSHTIEDAIIVRGSSISNYIDESFTVSSSGSYFLGFFSGSYDRTGGTVLGATMDVEMFGVQIV
jgi:hypothetical protein